MKKDVIEAATAPPDYTIRSFLEYAYLHPALKSAVDRGDKDEEAQLQNRRLGHEGARLVRLKRYPGGMTSPPHSPRYTLDPHGSPRSSYSDSLSRAASPFRSFARSIRDTIKQSKTDDSDSISIPPPIIEGQPLGASFSDVSRHGFDDEIQVEGLLGLPRPGPLGGGGGEGTSGGWGGDGSQGSFLVTHPAIPVICTNRAENGVLDTELERRDFDSLNFGKRNFE